MKLRTCASCGHWTPTEIHIHHPGAQPHHARGIAVAEEMARATHALCAWPAINAVILAEAPEWLRKQVGGGMLTSEDDGQDCLGWVRRPEGVIAGVFD